MALILQAEQASKPNLTSTLWLVDCISMSRPEHARKIAGPGQRCHSKFDIKRS